MNSKHKKILQAILDKLTKSNLAWSDLEKFMLAIGAEVREGKGSAGVFIYKESIFPFHRPHPQKEAKKYQIEDLREFLISKGVIKYE